MALAKQTAQWLTLSESFNHALKVRHHWLSLLKQRLCQEIGHVENWAKTIETDVLVINEALDAAYKGLKSITHI